jgi:hypothetical protein
MIEYLQGNKNTIQISMSLLQCFGCRTRRKTKQYSYSILPTRKLQTLRLSNHNKTNVLGNGVSIKGNETTLRHINKGKVFIAQIDKQFDNSAIGLNKVPQSIPKHDDYPSTKFKLPTTSNIDQVDFDSAELMIRLNRLNNRLFRFEKYLRNTPVNTQQYKNLQAYYQYVRRQIREVKRKIGMQ